MASITTTAKDLALLKRSDLSITDLFKAATALKEYLRAHRRCSLADNRRALGLSERVFFRFLAVSRWSKKICALVKANPVALSKTSVFKLADKTWLDARQLFNHVQYLVRYLTHRKRKQFVPKKTVSPYARIDAAIAKAQEIVTQPAVFKCFVKDLYSGGLISMTSSDPDAFKLSLANSRQYVFQGWLRKSPI